MSTELALRPEQIRAEIAADPARREMLREATAELLTTTESFITRYVVLPDEAASAACALWCLHTWVLPACDSTPYLLLVSSEPGSGKTRAMEALGYLVRRPWNTSSTTPTALFRRMASDQPTLFLDEIDTVFKGGSSYEALRAILNAGTRRGATATRCDGKWGVVEYETFGAKCLAGLDNGHLPSTILDRSIIIHMVKTQGQTERLRPRQAAAEAAPLAHTLEAWASIVVDELAAIRPDLPPELSDRAADAWEALVALAEFAGDEWASRARTAAQALTAPSHGIPVEPAPEMELLPSMVALMQPNTSTDGVSTLMARRER
jgi:hypothetical protein